MIGQLGFVYLTNRKIGRQDINKRISRLFVNKILTIVCNTVSSNFHIIQLNKH